MLHALRAAFALGATFSFFIGLQFMPLAEAFAITFTGPIFITVLSIPVLGETVGLRRWSAVLVGFVGVVIMLRPGSEALRVEALLPLTAALCYAFVMLLSRKLSRREPVGAVRFWTAMIGTLIRVYVHYLDFARKNENGPGPPCLYTCYTCFVEYF